MKKWILVNKRTEETFINGFTNKCMYFSSKQSAEHFLHCFGKETFEGYEDNFVIRWAGEKFTVDSFCKKVSKSEDLEELGMLQEYLIEFKSNYSLVNLNFMAEFLNDKIVSEINKKRNKMEGGNGNFGDFLKRLLGK